MTVTRVHITVDTEFSIAGAFQDPKKHRPVGPPAVYCPLNGTSGGLGFLFGTLAREGIRATFFVEALNTCYFGDEPMGGIAREIQAAGHDVQLHLHPCWTYFEREDWPQTLQTDPPNDDITLRPVEEVSRLIRLGQEVFRRWGVPEPRVLRTGGLRVGRTVYEAMQRCGMPIASNVGLAIYRPAEPELRLYSGCHDVSGVCEFPVTTYSDLQWSGRKHLKTLTITGTSWPELRILLQRARALQVSDVVVLTHPFEYVKHRDITYEDLYPDRINRRRLESLCAFLANEPDFEAACMSTLGDAAVPQEDRLLDVPPWHAAGRMLVNRINHAVLRL